MLLGLGLALRAETLEEILSSKDLSSVFYRSVWLIVGNSCVHINRVSISETQCEKYATSKRTDFLALCDILRSDDVDSGWTSFSCTSVVDVWGSFDDSIRVAAAARYQSVEERHAEVAESLLVVQAGMQDKDASIVFLIQRYSSPPY